MPKILRRPLCLFDKTGESLYNEVWYAVILLAGKNINYEVTQIMFLKKSAKKIKSLIVSAQLHSGFSKFWIVRAYKLALFLMGKSRSRREGAYKVIEECIPAEKFSDKSYVKKLYHEILFARFMYGIAVREYFVYVFEKLSHEGRKTFVTRSNKYPYYRMLNDQNYTPYFNMKTETYRKFKAFYGREVLCIYDKSDLEKFRAFVQRHPKFIYKPADDYGGHGVEIYDSSEYDSLETLFNLIIFNGFCVVEELIVQAEEIARLHPQSVNTMRVVAYLSPSGETTIQWCFLRMGMGGSHTDNMSSGGLAAMVDPETGIIYSTGRDWKGDQHIFHPDTGIQLVGYQIPQWQQLKSLVSDLSKVMPQVRLVGWDLAYTPKGWVFVEGNARPQCVSAQITEYNGKLYLYQNMEKDFRTYYPLQS